MRALGALIRREFRLYFVSPIGWVVLALFFIAVGLNFYGSLMNFVAYSRQAGAGLGADGPAVDVNTQLMTPFFFNLAITGFLLLPLLTMRLMAEERRQGTIELLLTYPVSDLQVVLGKYLAALAFYAVMLLGTLWTVGVVVRFGQPDPAPLVAGYLGVFLYGGAFLSLGLMLSALTENQIVAGALALVLFLLLWMFSWAASVTRGVAAEIFGALSVVDRFKPMSQGVVDSHDVIFFVSLIAFGIFIAHEALSARRWKGE